MGGGGGYMGDVHYDIWEPTYYMGGHGMHRNTGVNYANERENCLLRPEAIFARARKDTRKNTGDR